MRIVKLMMTNVAVETLSDASKIGFDSANDDLKTAILTLANCVLTQMAQAGVLKDVFDYKIERQKQSVTFINAIASRALASLWFIRPVARFFWSTWRKQS